jgi:hypothetical protein
MYSSDYPEHFWRGRSWSEQSFSGKVRKLTLTDMEFGGNVQKIKQADKTFQNKINEILSKLSGKNTALEREIYIHNYLVNNVTYIDGENCHNAYGAIVNNKGVCEGYSTAFMVLMRRAGVNCILVNGVGNNDDHEWNMVELDGKFYHVDLTFDDPIINEGKINMLRFSHFNLTEDEISVDHQIKNNYYPIPSAKADKYNFFKFFGIEFSSVDINNAAKAIAFAKKNGIEYAELKVKSGKASDIQSFMQKNYYKVIEKANEYLPYHKISTSGSYSQSIDETHKIYFIKIN